MHRTEQFTAALLMLAAGALPPSASAAPEVLPQERETISRQTVSRQQVEADAEKHVREANANFEQGRYQDAIGGYLEAVKLLRGFDTEIFAARVEICRSQIAKCYYNMAQDAVSQAKDRMQAQDFEEAIRLLKQAIEYCPEEEKSLRETIAEFEKRHAAAVLRNETGTEALLPDKLGQDYRIQVLMRQGHELAQAGQLQQAIRKYQDILMIDPYNADALQNLRAVNLRSAKVADRRYADEHRKASAEMEWRWSTPILPEGETPVNNVVDSPVKKKDDEVGGINKKIRSIIIPRVDFEDVTIPTAIKFLQEESKRNDPERVGVNIFLRRAAAAPAQPDAMSADGLMAPGMNPAGMPMGPGPTPDQAPGPSAPGPSAAGDGLDGGDAEGAGLDIDADEKKISLIIAKKSLFDSLRYLCRAAGLKMRVEPYAVVVAPENVALDDLETKIFPVDSSVFGDIDLESTAEPSPLKSFFVDRGIRFPAGAQIVYDTRISRLIVTNTIENLRMIDEVIQEILSDNDPMVEIVAKFIEVNQNDLKELGFDYTVNYNPNNTPDKGVDSSHRLSIGDSLSGLNRGSNELFVVKGFVGGEDGAAYAARILAANQLDSKDVLASPRITTLAGRTAHIEMIREVFFVDEYNDGEFESGSTSEYGGIPEFHSISPSPEFDDDPTKLGIMMDVTPEVDKTRRTIRMRMNPRSTSFAGWDEYRSTDASGTPTLMRKPIIDLREIDTTVTIYDGETIVLGGVIDDSSNVINDKIPILGDLPLVGRLFQSRSVTAEKRNLLIFMTCRLVKPDGTSFYPAERVSKGLPEQGRLD